MNYLTSDLPASILLIAIGVIIGAALTKILNRGPSTNELQQKLEDTQNQFDSYQKQVGDHFQKTADLVNQLTESYQNVHEHLSQGAQTLAHHSSNTLHHTDFKALSDQSNNETEKTGNSPSAPESDAPGNHVEDNIDNDKKPDPSL